MTDMTITPTVIEFGACRVQFGGTDLGATSGGVVMTYTPTYFDFVPDQLTIKTNKFLQAETAEVTVPMAEFTVDSLDFAIPAGTLTSDSTKRKLEFGGGTIASGDFKELIITPVIGGSGTVDTDENMKVTLYKAMSTAALPLGYNKDGVRIIEITFDCIRDATKTAGLQLGVYGDTTAS